MSYKCIFPFIMAGLVRATWQVLADTYVNVIHTVFSELTIQLTC